MDFAVACDQLITEAQDDSVRIQMICEDQRQARNREWKNTILTPNFQGWRVDKILKSILENKSFIDPRNNLCIWARPTQEIVKSIVDIQQELQNMVPALWITPTESLHMTVLEIVHSENPERLEDYVNKLRPSFAQLTGFVLNNLVRLGKPQLNYDDSAVSITFVPVDEKNYTYLHLRRDLAKICQLGGVHVVSRYFTTSSHITIARFVEQPDPSDLISRGAWINKIESLNQQLKDDFYTGDRGEWVIGAEVGVEVRKGTLWYGGGESVAIGEAASF
ncbi:hypothetical protein BP6252_13250 [Coleophoma cylindrospora]|uniref:DUF1868 domain-containing protein n=1 Tax=Coleophoma cylindrospora TaxID=1849047 RepID=A0A3D8QBD9_9HELO|nr:hypothetical protein BP6252_13250 [Coleophoma cylindrospora]